MNLRRDAVYAAITAGVSPAYPRGSQNFSLKLAGGKRAVLVKSDGEFTEEGNWWSAKTGEALPQGIDYQQRPITDLGGSQFIMVKGKKSRVRTWDPIENAFKYTKVGILWSANRRVE